MLSKQVTNQDGTVKTVMADSEKELKDVASQVEKQRDPGTSIDINVPVMKGHDLVAVDEDMRTFLADGSGAHNSPRDAVRDDGSIEGNKDVPVVVAAATVNAPAQKLEKDGKVTDLTAKDEKKAAEASNPGVQVS